MERQPATYHHGDLRRALLDAAMDSIARDGASRLTLRGVARATNVSHAAPYHYFKDKGALLAAVAEEGFRNLDAYIKDRTDAATSHALALQEAAVAYVVFAVTHPDLFRVMFGPQLADKTDYPSLRDASRSTYRHIEQGIGSVEPGEGSSGEPTSNVATASWSLIHGLAMLLIDRQFGAVTPEEAEGMALTATNVFWIGLSNMGGSDPTPTLP